MLSYRIRSFFNLIEVTLAIAIVGLGVASIMAMFPVGISASRDAVAQNYCANTADEFIAAINAIISGKNGWKSIFIDTGGFQNVSNAVEPTDIKEKYIYPAGSTSTSLGGRSDSDIFFDDITPNLGTGFAIVQFGPRAKDKGPATATGEQATFPATGWAGTDAVSDFLGVIRFSKSKISNVWLNGDNTAEVEWDYGAVINIEISWPLAKPYAKREKRYYSYELYNLDKSR